MPYTPEQLKEHLESQFEDWMTWDNYGEWHVDHIHPQSLLPYDSMDHPNFQKCWALENLQPLEARENIIKSNKILDQSL
jgi:5-methylcytosine-specific restriction endonuclease McrA